MQQAQGRTTKVTDPSGVAVTTTFNKRGEPTRLEKRRRFAGSNVHLRTTTTSTTYDWDPDSNRISETSGTDPPTTSTFDDAGRRVADSDGTTYDYDDDGNLVGIDRATGDDLTLTYNAFGELSGATSGSTNVDYELDPLGRTASRDDGTTSTDFGYDAVSGELASAKTGTNVTELLRDATGQAVTAKVGTTLNHLSLDMHGDVAASTTNTTATLGATAIYDPFGTATTTGTAPTPLGYQGDRTDPTTGLVDMGARNYLPETGAFSSPDTVIGDLTSSVTLNRYTYAWGDPINMFDPDGHWPSWASAKNAVSGAINWVADNVIKPAANAVRSAGNWVANTTRSAASRVASAVAQARTVSIKATKAAKAEIQKISRQVTAAAARMDTAVASGGLATSFTNSIARAVSRLDTSDAHTALAVAGLIPVVGEFADGADAVLYLIEGDTANALLSAAAMLPVGGQAAGLARLTRASDSVVARAEVSVVRSARSGGLMTRSSANMDSFLASGATVHHRATATAIGDDPATITNLGRSIGARGRHDVIVHGTPEGRPIVNGSVTHTQQIADTILENPHYVRGCSITLVMCHGGRETAGQLSKILGVDVYSTTRKAQLHPVTGALLQGAW